MTTASVYGLGEFGTALKHAATATCLPVHEGAKASLAGGLISASLIKVVFARLRH